MYDKVFSEENKVIGVLWSHKRDSGLWFGPTEWKEHRLGIQLLPLFPISEVLFCDVTYVEWTLPALKWCQKEFVYMPYKKFMIMKVH